MPVRRVAVVVVLLAGVLAPGASDAGALEVRDSDAYVLLDGDRAVIGNALVSRTFSLEPAFSSLSIRDERTGREWGRPHVPFAFSLGGVPFGDDWVPVTNAVSASVMPRGGVVLRVRLRSERAPFVVTRRVEVLPGVAGFASRTAVTADVPFAFDRYDLERVVTPVTGMRGHGVDMRGGADWRDATGYDYRADLEADPSGAVEGTGEWLDVVSPDGDGFALLLERRNYHSSVVAFDGRTASAGVDTSRDSQYLGPIEPGSLGENGTGVARYLREVDAGATLELEPVFLALGTGADDLPWQAYRYLRHRMRWSGPTVDFNTDKLDAGAEGRGRGAKDDADFPTVMDVLPVVERLGAEVFVLDDGWMPRNGDWWPDPDRFPDGFEPLLDELGARGMRLGLWMAPANFHPASTTFRDNPEWSCTPVGTTVGAANALDPEGEQVTGSAEPGIGFWNMLGVNRRGERVADRLRQDIDRLVRRYDVAKFKFDFLLWLDCVDHLAGGHPRTPQQVNVYEYHDAFLHDVVDPLVDAHPEVGFGVDETNDYRAFPYESILRGPTWFQNGTPDPDVLLHNVWTLAPYVPGFTLGMHVLGGSSTARYPVDHLVAVSMLYQPTIWKDVREFVEADGTSKLDVAGQPIIETARAWFEFYKDRRHAFARFTYPLLGDPLGGTSWAAFQPWDRDAQEGLLVAFRQAAPNASQPIPMRGVDPDQTFELVDEVAGEHLGSFSGAELLSGVTLTAPHAYDFRIIRVRPAP